MAMIRQQESLLAEQHQAKQQQRRESEIHCKSIAAVQCKRLSTAETLLWMRA